MLGDFKCCCFKIFFLLLVVLSFVCLKEFLIGDIFFCFVWIGKRCVDLVILGLRLIGLDILVVFCCWVMCRMFFLLVYVWLCVFWLFLLCFVFWGNKILCWDWKGIWFVNCVFFFWMLIFVSFCFFGFFIVLFWSDFDFILMLLVVDLVVVICFCWWLRYLVVIEFE